MKKRSNLFIKYIIFTFICFVPLFANAAIKLSQTSSDIAYGKQTGFYWSTDDWRNLSCSGSSNSYWSYSTTQENGNLYVRVRNNNNTINDMTATVTCTIYKTGLISGFLDTEYRYTFTFPLKGKNTPTTGNVSYEMYKGDTINLKSKLSINNLKSISHSTGSAYGTIKTSGCVAGTGACSLVFNTGTASQSRQHQFVVEFVGTDNVLYKFTVNVTEMDTIKTIDLGTIDPGDIVYGDYESSVSGFSCSKSSSGVPATVSVEGSGSKYRIKIKSDNNSPNAYNDQTAVCTFTKNSKKYTYTYKYTLAEQTPEIVDKKYDAYPKDVINIYSNLKMDEIISWGGSGSGLTYSGCSAGSTSCKVTMKSKLTEGRKNTFTAVYYDKSGKLKKANITITEHVDSESSDLGSIGAGSSQTVNVPLSDVTCTVTGGPTEVVSGTEPGGSSSFFEIIIEKISEFLFGVTIKNNNQTVTNYENITYSCTGVPDGVGAKEYTYDFTFDIAGNTVPVKNVKSYELFPSESINFADLYKIKQSKSYKYVSGSKYKNLTIKGCSSTSGSSCSLTFTGTNVSHNREHQIVLTYVNQSDILYETTVNIIERDPKISTKAYPGLLGFCEFSSDWEYSGWADSSGKNYSYYEAKKKGAKLPNCQVDSTHNTEKLPLTFKGWTKGYKPGDALNLKSTCGSDVIAPGKTVTSGESYVPCYEMTPHVRVLVNSGTLKNADGFEFRASDMSYIKTGKNFTDKVKLPEVEYSGFYSSSTLDSWMNNSTGEVKKPGDKVPLDGSVWVASTTRTSSAVDLYKNIGVKEVQLLSVSGMKNCTLKTGKEYLSVKFSSGDCEVTGKKITPFDVYSDVDVTLKDGTVRTYKFSVEDRSSIGDEDNGVFYVEPEDDNIEIGKNDESTLNDFKTDQCEDFFITIEDYDRYHYANAKKSDIGMYSGKFKVYQLCPDDYANYIALCLDPGRRGPQEPTAGAYSRTFNFKGSTITRSGLDYMKTDDIQRESLMGKMVSYIVNNYQIDRFNENSDTMREERAAAHVAIRALAIHTGFSSVPDPSDEIYASNYYPYLGIAGAIKDALADDKITKAEATNAVDTGKGGNGFYGWKTDVRTKLINTLTEFNVSKTVAKDAGFSRTIDSTNYEPTTNGYKINYKGTITAPAGATAKMTSCKNASAYGVSCVINSNKDVDGDGKKDGWEKVKSSGGKNIYYYDVTIDVPKAADIKPPTTVKEEKDLSFQITYTGGHDIVNAFIASPKNGSANVQRMLIFSTTNPKVYIYFSVLPKNCDLPVLDPARCPDEAVCEDNIHKGKFNEDLFKAAGCCRYLLDEKSYLFQSACTAECTSSTLSSICEYAKYGKEKADFYEIKEGAHGNKEVIDGKENEGCIVNTKDQYINDDGRQLSTLSDSANFTRTDDAGNIINVEAFNNNKYCQVTCKEDWQFSMDSFGNFIGADAVAAGTFFQIVSNDVFIGAKRTCYSTFINYDRFMNNIVELSDELVKAYNRYSTWSHVWTDISQQKYNTAQYFTTADSGNGVVCVEYFDKCPQGTSSTKDNYYWSDEIKNCRKVPNYGSSSGSGTTGANCVSKPTSYQGHAYHDGTVTYTNGGANDDSTQCTFKRTYCDGTHVEKSGDKEEFYNGTKECRYKTYKTRTNKGKDKADYVTRGTTSSRVNYVKNPSILGTCDSDYELRTAADGTKKCYSKDTYCPSGYTEVSGTCYSNTCPSGYTSYNSTKCYRYICASGYTESGGTCYSNTCPSGYSSFSTTECWKYAYHDSATVTLYMDPDYDTETLKCKVYGKGYDYTLKTENDIQVLNSDGKDIRYSTKQYDKLASEKYDDRDSIAGKGTNNRQNRPVNGINVKGDYAKTYTHNCTVEKAAYRPGAKGSSSCSQANLAGESVSVSSYSKTNEMFCKDGKYADLTGTDLDKAFCLVSKSHTDTNTNAPQTYASNDFSKKSDAFKHISESFMDHAGKEADNARATMSNYHTQIYGHAEDLFDCQNFELHNRTDDSDTSRKNNSARQDTIMNMTRKYVNINTDFDPIASYTYDEKFFMERVDDENVLVQYTEKNDSLFGGKGKYGSSTNAWKDATITVPSATDPAGEKVDTKLYRNFIETSYYNPPVIWDDEIQTGDANIGDAITRLNTYHDKRYTVTTPEKAKKYITLCTVGTQSSSGAYVAFTNSSYEWKGGRCYQVPVDYKKVHYVKSSLSNSSYYKNKGYWYVRSGDSKIHGNNISDAIKKFNRIKPNGYERPYANDAKEHEYWSRLGSFNVFPVSMATPRNLYQYTYTFGNVGSYYSGQLGRIMGTEKSIIQNNKRSCFYEVYEEICLCCGYKIEPGDLVEQVANGSYAGYSGFTYTLSDPSKAGDNTHGTIAFYPNTISLADVDLGRNSTTLASNWSSSSPFMYNGDVMVTDKGHKLLDNIEHTGENIYARKPEYAYFLTPDALSEIRSYNKNNGYDLNVDKLKVYDVSTIECPGNVCGKGSAETISFQHLGSKFLVGEIDKPIKWTSYGTIHNSYKNVCIVKDSDYSESYDMGAKMEKDGCRWVDFVETNQTYYNPTKKTSSNTWFRLSFK